MCHFLRVLVDVESLPKHVTPRGRPRQPVRVRVNISHPGLYIWQTTRALCDILARITSTTHYIGTTKAVKELFHTHTQDCVDITKTSRRHVGYALQQCGCLTQYFPCSTWQVSEGLTTFIHRRNSDAFRGFTK